MAATGGDKGEKKTRTSNEKEKGGGNTTSFSLFGRRIEVEDKEKGGRKTTSFFLFGRRIEVEDGSIHCDLPNSLSHSHPSTSTNTATTTIFVPPYKDKHHDDDDDEEKKKKKKRKRVDNHQELVADPAPHPGGWKGAVEEMGARERTFICRKELTNSDTQQQQNRLLLPKQSVRERLLHLLTEEETAQLEEKRIPAVVVDAEGRQWNSSFNYWKSSKCYNLNGDWMQMVLKCGLSSSHHIEVSVFRQACEARRLGFLVRFVDEGLLFICGVFPDWMSTGRGAQSSQASDPGS